MAELHPSVEAASRGELPPWMRAGRRRLAHMERVAELLEQWAVRLELAPSDRLRWRASGYLHDALRDAPEAELRPILAGDPDEAPTSPRWRPDPEPFRIQGKPGGGGFRGVCPPLLHGPASAELLSVEGVDDEELLAAVGYHTVGHPDLGELGRALICADYLEPGRKDGDPASSDLRERFSSDPRAVTREVVGRKLRYRVEGRDPIFAGTVGLWNRIVDVG